jgi:endonuclease YncB( thermonuclease family)
MPLAEEQSYSNVKCEANDVCALLANEKPDFSGFEAQVVRVIDADSIVLEVHLWPGQTIEANFRSRGIDAPELRNHKCLEEKLLAEEAAASIVGKFPEGSWVHVKNITRDKFGGRWLADIDRWTNDRLTSVTEELLKSDGRWGVPYDGEGERKNWCPNGEGK